MTVPLTEKGNQVEGQVSEDHEFNIRHGHELWRFATSVPEGKKKGRKEKEVLP